jgi:hypothetical protein
MNTHSDLNSFLPASTREGEDGGDASNKGDRYTLLIYAAGNGNANALRRMLDERKMGSSILKVCIEGDGQQHTQGVYRGRWAAAYSRCV